MIWSSAFRLQPIVFIAACAHSALPTETPPALAPQTVATPAPEPLPTSEASTTALVAHEDPRPLPTACEGAAGPLCTPPLGYVKRLCGGFFPDLALVFFAKKTPWSRGYLRGNVKAWNASGGGSGDEVVVFDEEVIVLAYRNEDSGGMSIEGATGSYDVLRWDGTCATLMREELTFKKPPKAKHAHIAWKQLEEKTQSQLRENPTIDAIATRRRKECKGVSMGAVSLACVKADSALSDSIYEYVRAGGEVASPEKMP